MKLLKIKKVITFAAAAAGAVVITTGAAGATTPVIAAPVTATDSYISRTAAKTTALNHAKVSASKITNYEIELDREKNGVFYEVEFDANGYEYDYKINAKTGTIVKSEKKVIKTKTTTKTAYYKTTTSKTTTSKTTTAKTAAAYITKDKAKAAALKHAGLKASQITGYKIELEKEKNNVIYDIEFTANGYKYDYDINAVTGKVIKSEKKAVKKTTAKPAAATTAKVSYIGEAKAKSIALNHAKVSANKAYAMKCKLEKEKGVYIYEVEFKSGRYEYEYDINASTGKIIKFDKEFDD